MKKRILAGALIGFCLFGILGCTKKETSSPVDTRLSSNMKYDVDSILEQAFKKDVFFDFKKRETKGFVVKAESVKALLGTGYSDWGKEEKRFIKYGDQYQLKYELVAKDSKKSLNKVLYGIYFDKNKSLLRTVDLQINLIEDNQGPGIKLDEIAEKILKLQYDKINLNEVDKRINDCIEASKHNFLPLIMLKMNENEYAIFTYSINGDNRLEVSIDIKDTKKYERSKE